MYSYIYIENSKIDLFISQNKRTIEPVPIIESFPEPRTVTNLTLFQIALINI